MKKVALMALIAIFSLSFSLSAQDNTKNKKQDSKPMPTEKRWTAKDRADSMEKLLKLTPGQKAQVYVLFLHQDAKLKERVATQQEKAENDAELEKIIGKEKMEQWKRYRDEQM